MSITNISQDVNLGIVEALSLASTKGATGSSETVSSGGMPRDSARFYVLEV